jgi:hypothetical protein
VSRVGAFLAFNLADVVREAAEVAVASEGRYGCGCVVGLCGVQGYVEYSGVGVVEARANEIEGGQT